MRNLRSIVWLGLIPSLMLVVALPAQADRVQVADSDDVAGRLDIVEVRHGHSDEGGITHRISTSSRWSSRLLRRDATEFDLWIDLDEDGAPDRVVYFGFRRGKLRGEMNAYEMSGDSGRVTILGPVKVHRPNRRSLVAVIPQRWIEKGPYDWHVTSYFLSKASDSQCRRYYRCEDRAPDSGWVSHE